MAKRAVVHFGCMDSRMTAPLTELENREGVKLYRFQVAGGIRDLVERHDPFLSQPYLVSAEKAIKEGGASEVWLSLHGGGCAGYSDVHLPTLEAEMRLHLMHLARAREIFRRHFEGVPSRVFYARPKSGCADELVIEEVLA